jgi:predicted SAM-dependent methyltransferase
MPTQLYEKEITMMALKVNVGCGATPTPGWENFDNSITVRLARYPRIVNVLARCGILNEDQAQYARLLPKLGVSWADARRRIPLLDNSAMVVYSSHMLEHLDPQSARNFLSEAWRVLVPGGILRIVVPDLNQLVRRYLETQDADAFVRATLLAAPPPHGALAKLRYLVVGHRDHLWMYDGASLVRLLHSHGFVEGTVVPPGQTGIPDPGDLNLREREGESVYVEAKKP